MNLRIGIGIDAHRRVAGRRLVLGGVEIPSDFGLEAHSDGDVVCHSIMESLLGAVNLGDKGRIFPPDDPQYKDISSLHLLSLVMDRIAASGYHVVNVDVSVMAEEPKISAHVQLMQNALGEILRIPTKDISIKGTTLERMGFTGRKEGIAALCVALLERGPAK